MLDPFPHGGPQSTSSCCSCPAQSARPYFQDSLDTWASGLKREWPEHVLLWIRGHKTYWGLQINTLVFWAVSEDWTPELANVPFLGTFSLPQHLQSLTFSPVLGGDKNHHSKNTAFINPEVWVPPPSLCSPPILHLTLSLNFELLNVGQVNQTEEL